MYKWKKEEVEILEKFYVELGPVALLREFFPHLNIDCIKYKAKKLGLCRTGMKIHRWKKEEVEILEKFYIELGPEALIPEFFPHLSIDCINLKAKKLGLHPNKNTSIGKYIYYLNGMDISIIDNQKVKGDSILQCNKCKNTWQARIYDVYHRRQECVSCSSTVGSKIANKWLDELHIANREVRIPNTKYIADGMVGDTVYEFLGDYWHGNPEKFNPSDTNPSTNRAYGDLLIQTLSRFEDIKKLGYTIAYIWEDEYIQGKPFSYW